MPSDRLERMRRNPVDDWQIGDVEAVCREFGILFRHGKGSHSQVKHPAAREILTIPSRRPIKRSTSAGLCAILRTMQVQK